MMLSHLAMWTGPVISTRLGDVVYGTVRLTATYKPGLNSGFLVALQSFIIRVPYSVGS